MSRYDQTELDEARQRIGALLGEREDAEPAGEGTTDAAVDPLLTKAGAKLDETGDEDRAEIIDLIETIRDARSNGDSDALEAARSQLQDLLFYLET